MPRGAAETEDMMRQAKWLAAACVGAALFMSGCGGLGGSYSDAAGQQKKEAVLRVGSDLNYPPFEYEDNGRPAGFDMELIAAVADRMGAKLEVENITFGDLIAAVNDNKVDAVISGMEGTDARAKELIFCDPYVEKTGYAVLKNAGDNAVNGWNDLAGKVVATQAGTRHTELSIDFGAVRVEAFDEKENVIKALKDGKVAAAVLDAPVARYYADHDASLAVAGDVKYSDKGLVIAVKKGNTELQKQINGALKSLRDDGTYDKLYKDWFGGAQ